MLTTQDKHSALQALRQHLRLSDPMGSGQRLLQPVTGNHLAPALFAAGLHEIIGETPGDRAAATVFALTASQSALMGEAADDTARELSPFFDRLRARLGEGALRRFAFRESHLPERASGSVSMLQPALRRLPANAAARPFLLLSRPEAIIAMAELPDYPPRRFTWRRVHYRVIKAEGPERIDTEWWRGSARGAAPRDYYAVETETGRRFWIFREGLYVEGRAAPCWFLHGLLP